LYGYEIRDLFKFFCFEIKDWLSSFIEQFFRIKIAPPVPNLLWHDPHVNLTIAHRNLKNIFFGK